MRRFDGDGRWAAVLSAAVLCLGGGAARADVIEAGGRAHQGTFEGLAGNRIRFRASDGTLLTLERTQMRAMTIDPPREVRLIRHGASEPVTVTLTGYGGGSFEFEQAGASRTVLAMRVESIEPRPAPGPGEAGSGRPDGVPPLDVTPLEARRDLTAAQTAALNRYRAARRAFDAFAAESSEMVSAMNGLTGARREKALDALRLRKNEEQPLKRELERSTAALRAAVPEPWDRASPLMDVKGDGDGNDDAAD